MPGIYFVLGTAFAIVAALTVGASAMVVIQPRGADWQAAAILTWTGMGAAALSALFMYAAFALDDRPKR